MRGLPLYIAALCITIGAVAWWTLGQVEADKEWAAETYPELQDWQPIELMFIDTTEYEVYTRSKTGDDTVVDYITRIDTTLRSGWMRGR